MQKLPDPLALKPLLDKLPTPYEPLKKQAESRVTCWEWATGELRSLRPWHQEIHGLGRGKPLAKPPRKQDGCVEFGFDAEGGLAVIRRYCEFKGRYAESFFVGHGDEIIEYAFAQSPNMKSKPQSVRRYCFEGGRLVAFAGLSEHGAEGATYDHDEQGRLVTIRSMSRPPVRKSSYHLRYSSGSLVAIEDDAHRVAYKRSPPKLADLLKGMRQALVRDIPAVVRRFELSEPAFCLALAYDGESCEGMLPPTIVLGLESERQAWEEAKHKKSLCSRWDPQEFGTFDGDRLDLGDDHLLEIAGDIAHHLTAQDSTEPARKLLIDVCRELNKQPWSKLTKVTKDFVVYPIDLEGAHLKANMKAVLPATQLKALQRQGLL